MEEGGDAAGCKSTPEAEEGAAAFDADKRARLPRPGQVDFINGGPPCQVKTTIPAACFPFYICVRYLRLRFVLRSTSSNKEAWQTAFGRYPGTRSSGVISTSLSQYALA